MRKPSFRLQATVLSSCGTWRQERMSLPSKDQLQESRPWRSHAMGFSPRGLSDGAVNLWDVSARGVVDELMKGGAVSSVAFSGDGTILALGYDDKTVRLWGAETGAQGRHPGRAYECGHFRSFFTGWYHPRLGCEPGNQAVAGSTGVECFFAYSRLFQAPGVGSSVSYHPRTEQRSLRGGPYEIVLWNLATQAQTAVASSTTTLSFSVDGKQLASKTFDGFYQPVGRGDPEKYRNDTHRSQKCGYCRWLCVVFARWYDARHRVGLCSTWTHCRLGQALGRGYKREHRHLRRA